MDFLQQFIRSENESGRRRVLLKISNIKRDKVILSSGSFSMDLENGPGENRKLTEGLSPAFQRIGLKNFLDGI